MKSKIGYLKSKIESSLLGLAPDGGCLAAHIAACAGGLLSHLFTLTLCQGVLFLWPCPAGFPAPELIRHRALWSADFPRSRLAMRGETAITRPTWVAILYLFFDAMCQD